MPRRTKQDERETQPGPQQGVRAPRASGSKLDRIKAQQEREQRLAQDESLPQARVIVRQEPQPHGGSLKRSTDTSPSKAELERRARQKEDQAVLREARALEQDPEIASALGLGEENSVENPERETMPGKNGGSLLRGGNWGNRGGQPGRSGRRSDEWRDAMAALGRDVRGIAYLRRSIRGKHGPQAQVAAYKYVTEQAHGKATLRAEIQGGDKPVSVIIRKE